LISRLAWFVAAALVWGAVDVIQAASASSGVGIVRLAVLTMVLYVACALVAAAVAIPLLHRFGRERRAGDGTSIATAFCGFGFVLGLTWVNVVHLPSILHPLSLAANVAMLAAAAGVALLLSRSPAVARLEGSLAAAALVALGSVALALFVARPTVVVGAEGAVATADPASPSVFVVILDSVRADRTSLAGRTDGLMPAFEGMIREGWSFSRAWAQSSWTKPSVGSLMTALFPSAHGATLRTGRLASEPTTLPEMFADSGYATAVFSANPWISPAFGFQRGVGNFVEAEHESFVRLVLLHRFLKMFDRPLPGSPMRQALGALERGLGVSGEHRSNCLRDVYLIDRFEEWLDEAGPGPYFAYLHLMSPHIPYDPPGVEHDDFPDAEQVALQRVSTPLPPERRERLIELYDATVVHGDAMLGRLLAALESRGLDGRSIVVATADHGEEFHEHGSWGHGNNLHEETVHVPLAVRGPGLAPRRVDAPVMLVDLLPTLGTLADAAPARNAVHGKNLKEIDAPRAAYAELVREGGYESQAMLLDNEKYIESKAGLGRPMERRVFDLATDPGETNDRSSASSAEALAEWAAALAALRDAASALAFESDEVAIDDEAAERLRGLGYLE
jgi:arylsulfatase A-like enzyme